jgi:hypothetical protein
MKKGRFSAEHIALVRLSANGPEPLENSYPPWIRFREACQRGRPPSSLFENDLAARRRPNCGTEVGPTSFLFI